MMFNISQKLSDARVLAELCSGAESVARARGIEKPASEHFVLAALSLSDQTARATFERLAITEAAYDQALESQRREALSSVGIASTQSSPPHPGQDFLPPMSKLYEAAPTGQDLVGRLAELRHIRRGRKLLSADVLLAVAQEKNSSAARAFRRLGIESTKLVEVAVATVKDHLA